MAKRIICGQLGATALLAVNDETSQLEYSVDGVEWSPVMPPLVQGDNININGNTISATATAYTAGDGISINSGTIYANLTAGDGINVNGGTVSCTVSIPEYTAGKGISISSGTVSADIAPGDGIIVDGAEVSVDMERVAEMFTASGDAIFIYEDGYVNIDFDELKLALGIEQGV